MKQVFDQLLKFLHDGISAIFRFVEIIWTWSVDQIGKLVAVPWQEWPLWKQFLLVLILVGVIWSLYRAGRELFEAGAAILGAWWARLPRRPRRSRRCATPPSDREITVSVTDLTFALHSWRRESTFSTIGICHARFIAPSPKAYSSA